MPDKKHGLSAAFAAGPIQRSLEMAQREQELRSYEVMRHITENGLAQDPETFRKIMEQRWQTFSPPPSYSQSVKPTNRKFQLALDRAIEQLPIRLANKIHVIRFGPDGSDDPHFEVIFKSGKVVTFEDVDHFPTDADIARIAVECP
jgi:hypothetical protein